MAADPELTDSLAVEIISQLEQFHLDPRRVHDDPEALSVLQIIGSAVVYFEPPATVLDLLWHRDAASTVAVVVTTDLPKQRQSELPGLLARLETETRSAASDDRLTVVTIGDRQHLPRGGESSGVALATVWWWNRVARWDVAAHISQAGPPTGETRVLADVKTETIVEIARWNLDLAARMAKSWSGDPQDISNFLEAQDISTQTIDCTDRCGPRPPESLIELWDRQLVDGWHDSCSISAHALCSQPKRIDRLVWAAQARVLLPWIEEHREILYGHVKKLMGQRRLQSALADLFEPPLTASGLVEIGPLKRIVEVRIGNTDTAVRAAARRLHDARNHLAHLEPLGLAQLRELVVAASKLA